MNINLSCVCGQRLAVAARHAGATVRCPACGNGVQVPAMGIAVNGPASPQRASAGIVSPRMRGRRIWPWLIVLLGLFLIAASLPFILSRDEAEKDDQPRDPSPFAQVLDRAPQTKKPEEVPARSDAPPPKNLIPELHSPAEKPGPPPEKPKEQNPIPKLVAPMVEIDRAEPAKPRTGGTLTVYLTGKDGAGRPVEVQYRASPKDDWKKADQGIVKLTKLAGPALTMEFRAVDARGTPSPIVARTWKIEPVNLAGQALLEWKLKEGDRFFQQLRVVQKPAYNIQGIPFTTLVEYVVVSSFKVEKAGPKGLEIQQKVEGARLLQADSLTQTLLAPAVLKLPGTTFTIHLDDKMDVKKFETAGLPGAALAQGAMGLQLASLLDQDGWKEMARTTFFQPNRPLKAGAKWSQPMTHNWGPLGSWNGKIHYAYAGGKGPLHQFAYGLELSYQAPKGEGGLGMMRFANAAFQARQAGGAIVFDADKGKVIEARERFLVRGRLSLLLLGQNTPVAIEEDQVFHVRILDSLPKKTKENSN